MLIFPIRRYRNGAWLATHTDRLSTHVISAIVHLGHKVCLFFFLFTLVTRYLWRWSWLFNGHLGMIRWWFYDFIIKIMIWWWWLDDDNVIFHGADFFDRERTGLFTSAGSERRAAGSFFNPARSSYPLLVAHMSKYFCVFILRKCVFILFGRIVG